jgi:DHA2 family methylenomycin A resistance protein-like MFS transporter
MSIDTPRIQTPARTRPERTQASDGATVRPSRTLLTVCIGFAMVIVDTTIVNIALPAMGNSLGAGLGALQWVVDGYVVMLASLLLSGGALADRFGTLRVFRGGIVVFTVASILCGLAPSAGVLIAARLLQGMGAAMLMPASMALIMQAYPSAAARASALGLFTTVAGSPQAFGPVAGGAIVDTLGWRSIFFLNIPLGIVTLVLSRSGLPDPAPDRERAIDVPSQLLAVLVLGAITTGLIEGHAAGWTGWQGITAAVLTVGGAATFYVRQRGTANPMLPPKLLAAPRLRSAVLIGMLLFAGYYGLVFILSLYLQQVRHLTPFHAGLAFLPSAIPIFALPVLAGKLSARFGARRIVGIGLIVGMTGALVLLAVGDGDGQLALEIALALLGIGVGLTVAPQITLVMGSSPPALSGIAGGLLNSARQTGYVIGVAVLGSLAAADNRVHGLHVAAAVAALAIAGALVATVVQPRAA